MSEHRRDWDWGQVGAKVEPGWWNMTRQIVLFVLGLVMVIKSIIGAHHDIFLLVCGLIVLGIVPVERIFVTRHKRTENSNPNIDERNQDEHD